MFSGFIDVVEDGTGLDMEISCLTALIFCQPTNPPEKDFPMLKNFGLLAISCFMCLSNAEAQVFMFNGPAKALRRLLPSRLKRRRKLSPGKKPPNRKRKQRSSDRRKLLPNKLLRHRLRS